MKRRALLCLAMALLAQGCETGVPTAPSGTVLFVTANPKTIPLTGTSTIEVVARDQSSVEVVTGTEIRFTTDKGRIDDVAFTDGGGVARATLQADGEPGTATVTARSGAAAASTVDVEIGPPTAAFSAPTISGCKVIFTDASTGFPTRWLWDFGDGGSSTEKDPVHEYAAADTYPVTLTVGHGGGEHSASRFLTIAQGTCP